MRYNDDENNKVKRWLKIGAWTFGIALFLFVGLFFLTIWLENKLERMVAEQSDGVYELQLHGLQLSPFIGNLSVDSLSLTPDYERWQQLNSQYKDVSPTLMDLQSREIALNGLNYLAVLFGSDPQLDEFIIENPEMLVTMMRKDTTSQEEPLHASVPDRIKGLQIGQIDLGSGKVSYRDDTDTASTIFSIQQFNLTVDDIRLDSQSFQAQDRAYYAARVIFNAEQAAFFTSDKLYRLTADSIVMNTDSSMLQAKQVSLNPTTDPTSMAEAKGEATAYMESDIPLIALTGIDFPEHSRNSNLIARHLLIQEPSLDIFKDKKNFENKYKRPFPHEIVQNVQVKFLVDTVELTSGFIKYETIVPEAAERGLFTLENLEITVSNFSNMPEHISMENPAVVQANGLVMGKTRANITSRMPLLEENGYHTLVGEVASTDPKILNPMVAPTAFIRIESGQISRGSVDLELTNEQATGTFRLIYSNFEIELLSKGTGGDQSLGKEILSELANWVAVKESNPGSEGEQPRVAEVDVAHEDENSIFNFWAKCLMDGFKSIATIM
ncbi:hypothetical protein [Pontibacter diazotrophicus]|uniref:hypothetical protein n=1 Tax=Pontibacter diazotrophicus TaxID=1400979 RepID=UPI0011C0477B|nr:hypothetical protein [Pontibacter diazotrophicus]